MVVLNLFIIIIVFTRLSLREIVVSLCFQHIIYCLLKNKMKNK